MFHLRFSSVLVSVATGESSGRYGNGQHTFLGELTLTGNGQLFRYKHVVGFTFDIWLLTHRGLTDGGSAVIGDGTLRLTLENKSPQEPKKKSSRKDRTERELGHAHCER